jgi:nucleoid DNA-binding protein
MHFNTLCKMISLSTGHPISTVREIITGMPTALMQTDLGTSVTTPLGTFRLQQKAPRDHKLPDGSPTKIPGKITCTLRPGKEMAVLEGDPRWGYYFE